MFRVAVTQLTARNSKAIKPTSPSQLCRSLSSTGGTVSNLFNKITGSSSSSPPTDQYAKQIYDMSHSEKWTLTEFSKQIKDMSGGWKSKLPFINNTDHVKHIAKMQALLQATMDVVGTNAGHKELKDIGKKEKLMICLKCDTDFQDINALVGQFKSMDIMHRVLRYRLENNMSLPETEEEAKSIMQSDLKTVLSQKELKEVQKSRMGKRKK